MHPDYAVQAQFRFGEAILKARTLLITDLPANRRAKSFFRLAPILAATLAVGSCFAPAVRGTGPSDSLSSEDAKVGSTESANVTIPGPLRSFLRMAGISQKVSPEEVMPLLARNVFELGYEERWPKRRPSEFLFLFSPFLEEGGGL